LGQEKGWLFKAVMQLMTINEARMECRKQQEGLLPASVLLLSAFYFNIYRSLAEIRIFSFKLPTS